MRLSLRTVSNGLFLIFLGVVLLLINYGIIGWNLFAAFIDFWPVILIVLGLGLVFNRRLPASLAFLVLGIVMVTTSFFAPPAQDKPFFNHFPFYVQQNVGSGETIKLPINYPLDKNLTKGRVQINGGGATINIAAAENSFSEGDITSYGGKPNVDFKTRGSEGQLTIDANWSGRGSRGDDFDLKLTNQLPLDLVINSGALSGKMDFSKIKLNKLEVNSGAADARLEFGDTKTKTQVRMSSAASKITLVIPKEVGVKLRYNGLPIGAIDFSNGATFDKEGNTYTTANFSTAETSLDIDINGAATKIEVVQP